MICIVFLQQNSSVFFNFYIVLHFFNIKQKAAELYYYKFSNCSVTIFFFGFRFISQRRLMELRFYNFNFVFHEMFYKKKKETHKYI